jgi:endonuclease/exonuclease/phosphatase family metal-dependent hydrolase
LDIERLAAIIESSQADVVSLNEVLHPVVTHYNEARPVADLANLLRMDWAFGQSDRVVQRPGWWGPIGNAVLSRYPIMTDANHYLPRLPMTQRRNLLTARIDVSQDRSFTVYSTHLDHVFEGIRLWQLRGVLNALQVHAQEPHVLLGDFNTHGPVGERSYRFTPPVVRMLRKNGYVDAYMKVGEGDHATFRYLWPFRIDYIFVPSVMVPFLVSCRTLDGHLVEQASDHRPLMAEFAWNGREGG